VPEWVLPERRAGAEVLGVEGEEQPLFLSIPSFMASTEEDEGAGLDFLCSFFSLSPVWFLWCASHLLGIDLGEGQRGACKVPPSRGLRWETCTVFAMIF